MKKSIKIALAGLLVAPVLALGVAMTAPATQSVFAEVDVSGGAVTGAKSAQGTGQSENLFGDDGIFRIITNTALYIIGAISVLMLIYGGIRYTISGGTQTNIEAAKNTIMYAVIGIVVALLAYAIVNFVLTSLIA